MRAIRLWLVITLVTIAGSSYAQSNECTGQAFTSLSLNESTKVDLSSGSNTLAFSCNISTASVISVSAIGVTSSYVKINDTPVVRLLRSSERSYLIEPGENNISIDLVTEGIQPVSLTLQSLEDFHSGSMTHNTVMSLYIGLCVALAMYVGLLGRGIRNSGFYAYSVYLVSLALFFGVQEGVFNYYFNHQIILNTETTQSFFAGIVVFSATQFISKLLEFKFLIPVWFYRSITATAIAIGLAGVSTPLLPQSLLSIIDFFMGWATLFLVATIFAVAVYAAKKQVQAARIIVLALSFVLVAMVFRIWLTDVSEFLRRYALVIGTAVESFLFAMAASEKVRYLEKEKSRAYHSATQDALCSVMNRRGWLLAANRQIEYHRKRGGFIAVQFVDINDFKSINDKYGHAFGDKVLQTLAKVIRHQAREDDIVGRLGGDEFVVFSNAVSQSQAKKMSKRFTQKLSKLNLNIGSESVSVSASVGTVVEPADSANINQMLDLADKAMYTEKQSFQNTAEIGAH